MKIAILNPARPRKPTETMMNEYVAKEFFSQAERFLKSAWPLEPVQSALRENVARSREFYSKAAVATLDGGKALTELADAMWSSIKMLNDKIIHNAAANAEAAFDAAQALAGAKSFSEAAAIQSEFVQQFAARTAAQNKEFLDLFARAADHVIETAHAAVSKSLKAGF
jgi:hypothetical protein